jgi:uncharacterized protein (DUF433 family)
MESEMVAAPINYICINDHGKAVIAGTKLKVSHIAIDAYTWGHSPETILENYPQLTLAEIHAALAYYHGHRDEIDKEIASSIEEVGHMRATKPNPLTKEELEARLRNR